MLNAGRVACIFAPFALCLASLVCIILVFLGGWNARSTALGDFYFLKVSPQTPLPSLKLIYLFQLGRFDEIHSR
jgi:hypothetical protein